LIDFLIIGAQRSGTTSLYNYLIQHPDVAPANKKEIHFFDDNYDKGLDWYYEQFPSLSNKSDKEKRTITGESTPYYLFHPMAPERVFKTIPKVKLIVLLRNPTDRAYSHYNHAVRVGNENVSFEKGITLELLTLKDEEKKVKKGSHSDIYQKFSYLERGIYLDQLKNWFEYFPQKQFLFLKSEDFFSNPQSCMDEFFKFLGISEFEVKNFEKFELFEHRKMSEDTREKLDEFFKPYNQRLYKFLGTDFGW